MIAWAAVLGFAAQVSMEFEAGWRDHFFPDSWTRMTAVVRTEGAALEGELHIVVRSGDAVVARHGRRVSLGSRAHRRYSWDVFLNGSEREAEAVLLDGKGRVLRQRRTGLRVFPPGERRVLEVGGAAPSLYREGEALEAVTLSSEAQALPDHVGALLALDAIVFPEPAALTFPQQDALLRWVREGGRLIFSPGRRYADLRTGLWKDLCPIDFEGTRTVGMTVVAAGKVRRGRPLFVTEGVPLGVGFRQGFGEVTFLAFPLDADPVPVAGLWHAVLSVPARKPEEELPDRRGNERGVSRVSTAELVRGTRPPEGPGRAGLGWGLAILAAYVLWIGPVEYLRLRRKGRLRGGGMTFAAAVAAGSAIFLLWHSRGSGRESHALHRVFAGEGAIQTFTAIHAGRAANVSVSSGGPVGRLVSEWRILSEAEEGVPVHDGATLRLPMPVGSLRQLVSVRVPSAEESGVTCRWAERAALRVEVENGSTVPLKDCAVILGDRAFAVGDLGPGASRAVGLQAPVPLGNSLWEVFYARVHEGRDGKGPRFRVRQRGVDVSGFEGAIFVGHFDRDLSGLRPDPAHRTEVRGVYRVAVEEEP